jgi:hypothetical protein
MLQIRAAISMKHFGWSQDYSQCRGSFLTHFGSPRRMAASSRVTQRGRHLYERRLNAVIRSAEGAVAIQLSVEAAIFMRHQSA